MPRIVVFTLLFLTATGVASLSRAQSLLLTTVPFEETEFKAARIAGQLVSGVQYRSAPDSEFRLEDTNPVGMGGQDRLLARRLDRRTLRGFERIRGRRRLERRIAAISHPTRMPHMLLDRSSDAIAIRLSPSPCSEAATEATLITWGKTGEKPELLVNSFQADAVYAYVGDDPAPVPCEDVALDGRSAYDMRCPLSGVDATGPS